jgi:hypothetical protein
MRGSAFPVFLLEADELLGVEQMIFARSGDPEIVKRTSTISEDWRSGAYS